MHIEGLLHANLCLASLLSSVQCSQLERFRLQHVQMVNKTNKVSKKLFGDNAKGSRINRNTVRRFTFPRSRQQSSRYKLLLGHFSAA